MYNCYVCGSQSVCVTSGEKPDRTFFCNECGMEYEESSFLGYTPPEFTALLRKARADLAKNGELGDYRLLKNRDIRYMIINYFWGV